MAQQVLGEKIEEMNKTIFVQSMKIILDSKLMSPLFVLHFRHCCDNNKNGLGFFPTSPFKKIILKKECLSTIICF